MHAKPLRTRKKKKFQRRVPCAGEPQQRIASAAKQVAEKCSFGPSGVKTPEENADFMSRLKARPTKLETFSAACKAGFKTFASAGLKPGPPNRAEIWRTAGRILGLVAQRTPGKD
jgi:hypothetical protein